MTNETKVYVITSLSRLAIIKLRNEILADKVPIQVVDLYSLICKDLRINGFYDMWLLFGDRAPKMLEQATEEVVTRELSEISSTNPSIIFGHPELFSNKAWHHFAKNDFHAAFLLTVDHVNYMEELRHWRKEQMEMANPSSKRFGMWHEGFVTQKSEKGYKLLPYHQAKQHVMDTIKDFEEKTVPGLLTLSKIEPAKRIATCNKCRRMLALGLYEQLGIPVKVRSDLRRHTIK